MNLASLVLDVLFYILCCITSDRTEEITVCPEFDFFIVFTDLCRIISSYKSCCSGFYFVNHLTEPDIRCIIKQNYAGYRTSDIAKNWRVRTGINQGDTALCTEINLMLGLMNYGEDISVDFEIVWAQGHVDAERREHLWKTSSHGSIHA